MSRRWKLGVGVLAALVAFNVGLRILRDFTGGSPGGPRSSSYATGGAGLAAYAALLARTGHPVRPLRAFPHSAALDPAATVVLLDPDAVGHQDALALRRFLEAGGRLIAGGAERASWLGSVIEPAPRWSSLPAQGGPLAPVAELAGVNRIEGASAGSWSSTGEALPAYGDARRSLVAVDSVGKGRLLLLADAAPLQNRWLASADNASLGLGLAGADSRPVIFLEAYHGYGPSTGLSAIPTRWLLLFAGLGLAAVVLMLARGRRLGPPDREARELPPPRRDYVDALAGVLSRTGSPEEALAPVRAETQARIARRAALPASCSPDQIAAAGRTFGLTQEEVDAMLGRGPAARDLLAAGRALARSLNVESRRNE